MGDDGIVSGACFQAQAGVARWTFGFSPGALRIEIASCSIYLRGTITPKP